MYEVDTITNLGMELEKSGDRSGAISRYKKAIQIVNNATEATLALHKISYQLFSEAIATRDSGDTDAAIDMLVQSIELHPASGEPIAELARLQKLEPEQRDLTKECFIFTDAVRADKFYRDAIQTCVDFVIYGGIPGDILEFGVLGGWTARRYSEVMRDSYFLGDLWLFDSFEGLPKSKHDLDMKSHDVQRGAWQEDMVLPNSILEELGMPIEEHIKQNLSRIISSDRIRIRKGFFSETFKAPINAKASIVHLDCDLYQSTVEVLDVLHRDEVLQDGTILMFDDWNCNRANPAYGQRRALGEFLERHTDRYSVSHYMNYGFNCAAYILHINL